MARPLPSDLQACDGTTDRLARDLDRVMILQVALQQGGGPDGRMIAEVSRIRGDDLGDQGIHAAVLGSGTTRTWGVGETSPQVESGATLEPTGPVVDRLTAHVQGFGDRLDLLALV